MPRYQDYPEFKPNLTPTQIMKMGSFGGMYWRPIYSSITRKNYKNKYKEFDFKDIDKVKLTIPWDEYNKSINKYKVKVGSTLEEWESKGWIVPQDPYGWFQWYARFNDGRRTKDDERQIKRWMNTAGPNSRFRRALINEIKKKGGKWNDETISPKKRQTLQHWGYKLTKGDYEK